MKADVQIKKTDLNQYGELFEVIVTLENGKTFRAKLQEHEFENIKKNFPAEPVKSGMFERDETYN